MPLQTSLNWHPLNFIKLGKYIFQIALLLLLWSGIQPAEAQPNTLYFMKGIPQTKDLNPARPGIYRGFYLSLPLFSKFDFEAGTNSWNYNDLIHKGTGPQSGLLVVDLDHFIANIDNKNFFFESTALTILEGGFRNELNFFGFSFTEREIGQLTFNRDLIRLVKYGNYPFIGQTVYSGNLALDALHFHQIAFNFSHDASKELTIGFAAKLLFGTGTIHSEGINLRATSPANGSYLDIATAGRVNISAPFTVNHNSDGQIESFSAYRDQSLGSFLSNFGNPGFAVDFGFAYRMGKRTEFSASIIDLGVMFWKQDLTTMIENGHFFYQGIPLNDPTQPASATPTFQTLTAQLRQQFNTAFNPTYGASSFSTLLPAKIYFGVDYRLTDAISLSGLSRVRMINNTLHTSLTVSANTQIKKTVSLSASYSVMETTYNNLGLGIGVKAGPFQLYSTADNLLAPIYPAKASNINLRIGINLLFGTRRNGLNQKIINPDCTTK
jgi:hypothetical protein